MREEENEEGNEGKKGVKLLSINALEMYLPDSTGQWDDTSGTKNFLKGYGQLFEDMRPAAGPRQSFLTTFRLCYAIFSVIKIVILSFFVGFFSIEIVHDVAQDNKTQLWLMTILATIGCICAIVALPFADPFNNRVEVGNLSAFPLFCPEYNFYPSSLNFLRHVNK